MKNKKLVVAMGLIGLLLLVGYASSQYTDDLPQGVQAVNDCRNVSWEETVQDVGECDRPVIVKQCADEPVNESCTEEPGVEKYPCFTGTHVEQKSRLECTTEAYTINDQVQLNIEGYVCSTQKEGDVYTTICDSKSDGNGDGICHPGESCQKFIVEGTSVQKFYKNSQDEFTATDESFYLPEATVEVLP